VASFQDLLLDLCPPSNALWFGRVQSTLFSLPGPLELREGWAGPQSSEGWQSVECGPFSLI